MPVKKPRSNRIEVLPLGEENGRRSIHRAGLSLMTPNGKLRSTMSANEYVCAIERNQNGKYNVRVRASFGRGGWTLPVYFLASSFNAAMKKLEESLQLLQKNEEGLRFWGVERTDDPNLAGDLLQEFGLWLDRRKEFPRKVAELGVPWEKPVPASMLAPIRRVLADSVSQPRVAAAGD
ncbi:MAG: hypothetical protein WBP79_16135 [Candidatus Acidiferrales bacterium]